MRFTTIECLTIFAALANCASTAALSPTSWKNASFDGLSSHTLWAPGFTASSAEITAGSASYSTSISSAASLASSSVSATMNATGWPT